MKFSLKFSFVILFFYEFLNAQNFNDLEFGTDTTFDVISWNIEWFPKNNYSADYVEKIFLNLNADIYALQEIEDTSLLKQIVSNIPGFNTHFKSLNYRGLSFIYNTNTVQINSKYEIFNSQPYLNAFPRFPQVLDLNFKGENYIIINNHFKCCGDGILDVNDVFDEENRRLQAVTLLKQYIENNLENKKVILLGDLNDELIDVNFHNVFNELIIDTLSYKFVDMQTAQSISSNWSYPSWPSHLDHILITNELFSEFQNPGSFFSVIRVDDFMNSWSNYDYYVSDHRPVGLKLNSSVINSINNVQNNYPLLINVVDFLGRKVHTQSSGMVIKFYENGKVEKEIIIK